MTTIDIALLNASHYPEQTRGNFSREIDAELTEYQVRHDELPSSFEFDGAIVSGSVDSVYADKDWIDELVEWTNAALERGKPFLGICFGHQLLAHALGGTVEAMGEHEVGYQMVERVGESRLLAGLDDQFVICQGHSDTITELPPSVRLIAENEYGIQGFEGDGVFSMQGHPEYDRAMAELTVDHFESVLTESEAREAHETITDERVAKAEETKLLFDNFLEIVLETAE